MNSRVAELRNERIPFVHALVVRAQVPTSAVAGDDAIVLGDGSIEGFVGGQCAQSSVRAAALDVLHTGKPQLLRVLPDGEAVFPEMPGASVVVNPCLSGGALEIFLQPILPPPVVTVAGETPIARAVAQLAEWLGYEVGPGDTAVIIASHGLDEHDAIRAALDDGAAYIALVASPKRGSAVLDELGLTDDERKRISTPAGLDIGARTPEEIALSILAEVIPTLRRAPKPKKEPGTAIDPVCGMTVVKDISGTKDVTTYWFCSEHCRKTFADA